MVTAGDKYYDKFDWGKAEQFHSIIWNDQKFQLLTFVSITTHSNKKIEGLIVYIMPDKLDIMQNNDGKTVDFDQIASIEQLDY